MQGLGAANAEPNPAAASAAFNALIGSAMACDATPSAAPAPAPAPTLAPNLAPSQVPPSTTSESLDNRIRIRVVSSVADDIHFRTTPTMKCYKLILKWIEWAKLQPQ